MYLRDAGGAKVLLNRKHFKYQEDLQRLLDEFGGDEERAKLAKKVFDDEYRFNAGKYVIVSWFFRGRAEWSEKDWQDTLASGVLTVHLAMPTCLQEARHKLRQKLTTRKTPTE